ncbi:MAG: hypothetical protein ABIW84_08785, partial [Ilumatobacteraceae bacterium]
MTLKHVSSHRFADESSPGPPGRGLYLGIVALTAFAIGWLFVPLISGVGVYRVGAAAGVAVEMALLVWSVGRSRACRAPDSGQGVGATRGRFNKVLGAEMAGVLAVVVVGTIIGRPAIIGPGIAIVVGLHFIPVARLFGVRVFRRVAVVIVLSGVICLVAVLRDPDRLRTRLAINYLMSGILFVTAVI